MTIRRSARRRTVMLRVTEGGVTLHAPPHVPEAELLRFVERKRAWVEKHLRAFASRVRPGYQFEDGEALPFFGEALTVRLCGEARAERVGHELRVPPGPLEARRRAVEAHYRREALRYFQRQAREDARRLGCAVADVKLTEARTRWGSCTAAGVLRFNWRIALAPRAVAEYLSAHEVAHLREMNHGPRFWQTVAGLCPEYPRWREVLRRDGHTYTLGE